MDEPVKKIRRIISSPNFKVLECKYCNKKIRVSTHAIGVICDKCTRERMRENNFNSEGENNES